MLLRSACIQLKSGVGGGRAAPYYYWVWVRSKHWSSKEVRSKFIEFFQGHGHRHFPSSSVIPRKGDGTYFTNSGMNQFKPLFVGQCDPSSKLWGLKRAVNSQKCIRVGGKHNDLEDVGHDYTHHTFFEMMGSWSFGDYFKREACEMAYQLVTGHLSIPTDRLYFTYFGGDQALGLEADEECLDIWASLGIPRERILPFDSKDNFWDMGPTGPCGPCTEIHYDHVGGGRYAGSEVNLGSSNVVEIWNLVFMQYNRHLDQSLSLLQSQHIDTGMGLERMVAVMNGLSDNYKTDLFGPLFDVIQQTTQCRPYGGLLTRDDTAYRILADHSRMLTIAISDGLLPSSDNLGHKVRIILHKCIHLCRKHFKADPCTLLPALTKGVVASLGEVYPELSQNQGKVIEVISSAITHYDQTMEQANRNFHKMMSRVKPTNILSGELILALEKGHYGNAMALETIVEMAESRNMKVDMEGYQRQLLQDSKQPSSSPPPPQSSPPPISSKSQVDELVDLLMEQGKPATNDAFKYSFATSDGCCDFSVMASKTSPCSIQGVLGYDQGEATLTVQRLEEGQTGEIILDNTCFYAEAGGQEADKGFLHSETGIFQVEDVQNHRGYIVHSGHVTAGHVTLGQTISPEVSIACREGNMRNHTGTHLVNAALLDVLPTTRQEGSNINPYRFTFDFLALSKLKDLESIQSKVKAIIEGGHPVTCNEMSLVQAKDSSHIGWNQNEEYPDQVRVVCVGSGSPSHSTDGVSMELCGGTHVLNTADVEDFCITGLSTKAQHVQRVTCVTGTQARQAFENGELVEAMCGPLRRLHTCLQGKADANTIVDELQALAFKAKQTKEFSLHNLNHCTQVIDKGDVEKILSILESLCHDLRPLEENPAVEFDECVRIVKLLVSRIHQCQHLELLPRTTRHTAKACVKEMEHRVQALVNTGLANRLKQVLTEVEAEGSTDQLNFVTVEPEMQLRQVLKVVNKQASHKPIVLVQDGKSVSNLVLSIPRDSGKSNSEQDFSQILEVLQRIGPTKGKMASSDESRFVWKSSVKEGSLDDVKSCVQKWWEDR